MTGRTNSRTMKTGGIKNENYRRQKKTAEIRVQYWNGSGYGPDCSKGYFGAGTLPYNEEADTYTVDAVDHCIDMANAASCDFVRDCDMCVFVTEL